MDAADEAVNSLVTTPDLAIRLAVSLDWLRRQIRLRPDVAALFVEVGPSRAIPAARIEALKDKLALR